jgi:hypothetical protein
LVSHARGGAWIEEVLTIGCRGEYLDLRDRKWQETGEDCIMRSFVWLRIGTSCELL